MAGRASNSAVTLPSQMPILVLDQRVILPGGVARLDLSKNRRGCDLAEAEFWKGSVRGYVGLVSAAKGSDDLNQYGTAARVLKIARVRRGSNLGYTLLVESLCRIEITSLLQEEPYLVGAVNQVDHVKPAEAELGTNPATVELVATFREKAAVLIKLLQARVPVMAKLQGLMDQTPSLYLCDLLVMAIDASFTERLAILNAIDVAVRFKLGLGLLERQLLVLKTASEVGENVNPRRQLAQKRVKRPTSRFADPDEREGDERDGAEAGEESNVQRLTRLVGQSNMPPDAHKAATRALKKVGDMERSQQLGPEHQKTVTWLEWMTELPWSRSTEAGTEPNIARAREQLDEDHYGLEKIKQRIIEYTAVRLLNPDTRGTILCLVGPPGVGKTSLGRSIAAALGREFFRVSLGGVRDEADIRGFSSTYVGSQPGRIIKGLKQASTNDPVLLLDEIDKVSTVSANGSPAAALLEVLDPAQNSTFVDHYIGVPFDLSKIVFVATANSLDTIPGPLLDRMEVIQIPGYTLDEKVNIASKYIVPRQMFEHGICKEEMLIPEETLVAIGQKYTREAGVRNLERQVAAVCRSVAVKMVEEGVSGSSSAGVTESWAEIAKVPRVPRIVIAENALPAILGPPKFDVDEDPKRRVAAPGIAMGLAASQVGGSVLFVEATKMHGKGQLKLTGSLGDVIKESAHLALTWLRSHGAELGLAAAAEGSSLIDGMDIHIHFPEGAVGKDGPSAGVTLVTVLASLLGNRLVRNDTAMTGEITLSGAVLPIGGVEHKLLAAHRLGIKRIVLPRLNWERDLANISSHVLEAIECIPVDTVHDVLANTLEKDQFVQPRLSAKL